MDLDTTDTSFYYSDVSEEDFPGEHLQIRSSLGLGADKILGVNDTPRMRQTNHQTSSPSKDSRGYQELELAWRDISVWKRASNTRWCPCISRQSDGFMADFPVLNAVSGIAQPGGVTAIMGPRGSGKTSLLKVLANLESSPLELRSGQVLINGIHLGDDILQVSAFVDNTNCFPSELTLHEHIWFHANMKMDSSLSHSARMKRVAAIVSEVELVDHVDRRIGSPGTTQYLPDDVRKLISVAIGLLKLPSILFLEEVTSDMDCVSALNVMNVLTNLAARGRTVITTLYQPSSQVYALLNHILLLTGGSVAFQGSTTDVITFYSGIGLEISMYSNPADLIVEAVTVNPSKEVESRRVQEVVVRQYTDSRWSRAVGWQLDSYQRQPVVQNQLMISFTDDEISWYLQVCWCFWRAVTCRIRHRLHLAIIMIATTVSSLFVGLVYCKHQKNSSYDSNIINFLFVSCAYVTFHPAIITAHFFSSGINLFRAEHSTGTFSSSAYYLAAAAVDYPVSLLIALIYGIITYSLPGLVMKWDAFLFHNAMLLIQSSLSCAVGHAVSVIFSSTRSAVRAVPILLSFLIIFTGFLIKRGGCFVALTPIQAISFYMYGFEALMTNQWQRIYDTICQVEHIMEPSGGSYFILDHSCNNNGSRVLSYYGYKMDDLPYCYLCSVLILIGLEVFAFLVFFCRSSDTKCHRKTD